MYDLLSKRIPCNEKNLKMYFATPEGYNNFVTIENF